MVAPSDGVASVQEELKPEPAPTNSKKTGRHRRRHRRASNRSSVSMSDASTRSGSPSSSPSIPEAPLSRRGSADGTDLGANAADQPAMSSLSSAAHINSTHCEGPQQIKIAGTLPIRRPCPLSQIGDASQRQPMSQLATPVTSPAKKFHAVTGSCGAQLILPSGPLLADSFQCSPAGTPAATPVASYTVVGTSPTGKSARGQPLPTGDASQRTPLSSHIPNQSHNAALKSWLCGSPCGKLPSEDELAEILRAALPEAYDD
jgi:hypothetical protein